MALSSAFPSQGGQAVGRSGMLSQRLKAAGEVFEKADAAHAKEAPGQAGDGVRGCLRGGGDTPPSVRAIRASRPATGSRYRSDHIHAEARFRFLLRHASRSGAPGFQLHRRFGNNEQATFERVAKYRAWRQRLLQPACSIDDCVDPFERKDDIAQSAFGLSRRHARHPFRSHGRARRCGPDISPRPPARRTDRR